MNVYKVEFSQYAPLSLCHSHGYVVADSYGQAEEIGKRLTVIVRHSPTDYPSKIERIDLLGPAELLAQDTWQEAATVVDELKAPDDAHPVYRGGYEDALSVAAETLRARSGR